MFLYLSLSLSLSLSFSSSLFVSLVNCELASAELLLYIGTWYRRHPKETIFAPHFYNTSADRGELRQLLFSMFAKQGRDSPIFKNNS
jgi:hypothetical protein